MKKQLKSIFLGLIIWPVFTASVYTGEKTAIDFKIGRAHV